MCIIYWHAWNSLALSICCRSEQKIWSPLVTEEGKRHPYKMNLASEPQVSTCSPVLLLLASWDISTFDTAQLTSAFPALDAGDRTQEGPSTDTSGTWLLFGSSRKGTAGGKGWKTPEQWRQGLVRKGIWKRVEAFLCRTEWQNHGKIEALTQLMMDRWCKCAKDGKKFGSWGLQLSGLQGHVVVDPDIPGHPSSHYLVSESLRVEMLSALVFLKITKINW